MALDKPKEMGGGNTATNPEQVHTRSTRPSTTPPRVALAQVTPLPQPAVCRRLRRMLHGRHGCHSTLAQGLLPASFTHLLTRRSPPLVTT